MSITKQHLVFLKRLFTFSIRSATGFIGFPAAQAFVRAGHIVYGQTRSASKAKQLATEESEWA